MINPFGSLQTDVSLGLSLAARNLSAKYRQSFGSYIWVFIPPLVVSVAFTLANRINLVNPGDIGVPYPLFSFLGATLWTLIAECLDGPTQALISSKTLLTKINFNKNALIVSQMCEIFVQFFIRLTLVIGLMFYFDVSLHISSFLSYMVYALCLVFFTTFVGLVMAPLNMLFADVYSLFKLFLSYGVFVVPAVYEVKMEGTLGLFLQYNPLAWLLSTSRNALLGISEPERFVQLMVFIGTSFLLLLGLRFFRRAIPHLVDRMV